MLDLAMLEEIAPPGNRVYVGERPPLLEEVFARILRDGWAPRNPAYGPELEDLEVVMARGTCLEPLVFAGDELFIDSRAQAQSGDLVSFALSSRGADAQNSCLPPGQSPTHAGARWGKLYVRYRGYDMLLEKYGNSATASLMSCEHPDDIPRLAPVRNIRRNGQLLFAPDTRCAQIGQNAATSVYVATAAGPVSVTVTTGTPILVAQINVPALGAVGSFTHVLTVAGIADFTNNDSSSLGAVEAWARVSTGTTLDGYRVLLQTNTSLEPVGLQKQVAFSIENSYTVSGSSALTYNFEVRCVIGSGSSTNAHVRNVLMKLEQIQR